MYTVLVLLVLLNIFILPHHPHFALEKIPGFWAIFGAVIAIALARVAKGAAHTFLGKDVDFYVKNEINPTSSLKEDK
jgi:hypothetical protein